MSRRWQESSGYWQTKRVIVTGGHGFLGSYVVEALKQRGTAEVFVPRQSDYDLRQQDAILALLHDTQANGNSVDMVIHLAAHVGGIGINRAKPAEFFYDNLMMGVQLLHECWHNEVEKFVAIGTVCAYPKFAPIPFQEKDL